MLIINQILYLFARLVLALVLIHTSPHVMGQSNSAHKYTIFTANNSK